MVCPFWAKKRRPKLANKDRIYNIAPDVSNMGLFNRLGEGGAMNSQPQGDRRNMENASSSKATHAYTAGILAGPLFILTGCIGAMTRDGFDWVRHPLSLLSVGEWGWVMIAGFVVPGLFYIACARSLKTILVSGVGRTWAPRLMTWMAVGLIMGGVFTADPALGFPPGTPEGPPASMSWHSVIHAFAPIIGFFSLLAFLLVIARRFGSKEQKSWKYATITVGIGSFILTAIPNITADHANGIYNFVPLWIGSGVIYIFTSVVLWKLKEGSAG